VSSVVASLGAFFFSLGGVGLLLLGALDSSFLLFVPLGNDLLLVALTAAHGNRAIFYVAMSTLGSAVGVAFTYWASAKGARMGTEGKRASGRVAYVERKVKEQGTIALAIAAIMPPPFPFTLFIVVAAALQFPRRKMLLIVAGCRAARFGVEAWLARIYGQRIITMAQSPYVRRFIIALVVISIVGSAWSIFSWIRKSKRRGKFTSANAEAQPNT
jgi:membrane protein YqaA with SNARE-associated domain